MLVRNDIELPAAGKRADKRHKHDKRIYWYDTGLLDRSESLYADTPACNSRNEHTAPVEFHNIVCAANAAASAVNAVENQKTFWTLLYGYFHLAAVQSEIYFLFPREQF